MQLKEKKALILQERAIFASRQGMATYRTTGDVSIADISGAPVEQQPYKPDLVSCDFWAFLTLECALQGQKFGS
jgi:hypothetical protein